MFKNLKKHLSKTLFIAVLGLVTAVPVQAAVVLSFNTSSTSVDVNDTFTVELLASNDPQLTTEGIFSWDLDLFFDSAIFQLDNIAINTALFLPSSSDGDGIGGVISNFPFLPLFGNDIPLATFTFTALAAGASEFSTGFDDEEGFLNGVFAEINGVVNASLNITANAPAVAASAPASAAILIMAIAGLLLRRR